MLWLCLHSSRKTHFPGYVRIAAEEYSLDDFGDRFLGTISGILALQSFPPEKRSHIPPGEKEKHL